MKKFITNPISGKTEELKQDVFTAKFEHIATTIPVVIKLTEDEFKLMTSKTDMDNKFDQALESIMNRGELGDTVEGFQGNHFFDGVFCNDQLRSH